MQGGLKLDKEKISILEALQKMCTEQEADKDYFGILKAIFTHISKHVNEPENQRAESIKKIIDDKLKGSDG